MATNRASGNDRVAIQVGRVLGRPKADADRDETSDSKEKAAREPGAPVNIRSGDARVGVQADDIHGDVTIVITPRRKA